MFRQVLGAVGMILWLIGPAAADSVFYQPQNRDAGITSEQWQTLFTDLRRAGHEVLVVQWTAYDEQDFGGPDGWLGDVIDSALEADMQVWIGLAWNSGWFAELENRSPAWDMYLNRLLLDSLAQAERWRQYEDRPGFAGWYLPLELPDRGLADRDRQAVLAQHLVRLTQALQAPLAVSSYFTGFQQPASYAKWMLELHQTTGAEIWVQNGAGVAWLTDSQRAMYLGLLDCRIGIIHEAFEQSSAPGEPFAAVARPPTRAGTRDCHKRLIFSLRYLAEGSPLAHALD